MYFFVPAAAVLWRHENHWKSTERLVVFFHPHSPGTVLIIRRDILFPLELIVLRLCTTRTHQGYIILLLYYYIYAAAGAKLLWSAAAIDRGRAGPELYEWNLHDFYLWAVHDAPGLRYYFDIIIYLDLDARV